MKSGKIFAIAMKNLRRHRRRTALNIVSVAVTAGALLFFISFYRGTYIAMMRESFIKYKSGNIQIHAPGFDDKKMQDYVAEKSLFYDAQKIVAAASDDPDARAVSARLVNYGFVGNGRDKMVVSIIGCDPAGEKALGVVDEHISSGVFLDAADGVVLGKKTAELFGFAVGDSCYLQAQTKYGAPNVLILPVVGVYDTGFLELDKSTVFISLKSADILADAGGGVNKIIVMLDDMKHTHAAAARLEAVLGAAREVKTWEYYGQALLENEKGDGIFYLIFMVILLFVSVSTIMSTMYVNVFERVREIGTMRAIGWTRAEIFGLFIFESLVIGAAGSAAGIILGGIPTLYMTYVGVDYSRMGDVISIPIFKMICRPEIYDLPVVFAVGMLSTYFGGLLPARRAARMVITDALRVV